MGIVSINILGGKTDGLVLPILYCHGIAWVYTRIVFGEGMAENYIPYRSCLGQGQQ